MAVCRECVVALDGFNYTVARMHATLHDMHGIVTSVGLCKRAARFFCFIAILAVVTAHLPWSCTNPECTGILIAGETMKQVGNLENKWRLDQCYV